MISLMNKRIMCAEDEAFTRRVLATTLVRLGAEVIECADGEQALATLRETHKIDIVLLDVQMPKIHGLHVLKEIRSAQTRQNFSIPVALLTATQDEFSVRYAAGLSCDGFIVKPVTQKALVDRLDAMMKRRMQLPYQPAHYGTIDVGPPDRPPSVQPSCAQPRIGLHAPALDLVDAGGPGVWVCTHVGIDEMLVGMVLADALFAKGKMLVPPETPVTPELLLLLRELNGVETLGTIAIRPHRMSVD